MTEKPRLLIQKLRLQHGWSQEQLAELSGLSARTIQRVERGQPASVETLKSIAAVFEVDFITLKEPDMAASTNSGVNAEEALALTRIRRVRGFYVHLMQYGITIAVLAVANDLLVPHYPFVLWVALMWGIAVGFHGLRAFDRIPLLNGGWEKRQVEKYLGRKL
jgi:transcriptional regulator with XRE-family HTH domain